MLEMKINNLKLTIADAKIIDESKLKTDSVQILNKVELKNVKNGMKMVYTIVSESEANLKEGKISVNTPIAQGMLGKKVGDVAEIKVPQGIINLEVVHISFYRKGRSVIRACLILYIILQLWQQYTAELSQVRYLATRWRRMINSLLSLILTHW